MNKWGKLSWLFAGISIVIVVAVRAILGGWIDILWVPLILFLIFFIAALVVDYKFYLEFLTTKTTKSGLNMGAMILMALVLLVSINFLSIKKDKTFDMTEEKIFSLSDQSFKILKSLEKDLFVKVFYKGKEEAQLKSEVKESLNKYTDVSSKVRVRFINSYVENILAGQYLKSTDGFTVFVEYDGKRIKVEPEAGSGNPFQGGGGPEFTEQSITQAIIKATRKGEKTIYFLTGHGERPIDSEGNEGIKYFSDALKDAAYKVKTLNITEGETIPKDAAVIAIVGPQQPLFEGESKILREYATNGGSLFIAIDPGLNHQMALFTKPLGVEFKNNYIINDKMKVLGIGEATVLGAEYDGTSEITNKLPRTPTVFDVASEVSPAPDVTNGLDVKEIVKSHNSSYVVNELKNFQNVTERKAHTVAVTVDGNLPEYSEDGKIKESNVKKPQFSAVIFGDSDFLTTAGFGQDVNRDLALNSMSYLAKETDLISIRPKKAKGTKLQVTEMTMRAVVISSVTLPLLMFIISGILWHKRRNS